MKKILLTGDRPTGKLHLGHYVGSLKRRVEMQNSGEYEPYIMIADMQALTDNFDDVKKIKESIYDVALDYLSVGIEPSKSTIFVQSQIPQLSELMMYFMNLVTVSRLQRNPTVKSEIRDKAFKNSVPVGFFTYPISQAADILGLNADVVPVGEDQAPMIEQTKEIALSFNRIYGETFKIPTAVYPKSKIERRLLGLDGQSKMSKSLNNCIYLSDTYEELKQKVMNMYTDPNHIKITDPGNINGNMVFTYLDVFASDKKKVAQMKEQYKMGGLGDVACKKYLLYVLDEILKPIREKRIELSKDKEYIKKVLLDGSKKAREVAQSVLEDVRKKIGVEL